MSKIPSSQGRPRVLRLMLDEEPKSAEEQKNFLLNQAKELLRRPDRSMEDLSKAIEILLKAKEMRVKSQSLTIEVIVRLGKALILRNHLQDVDRAITIYHQGFGHLLREELRARLHLELGVAYIVRGQAKKGDVASDKQMAFSTFNEGLMYASDVNIKAALLGRRAYIRCQLETLNQEEHAQNILLSIKDFEEALALPISNDLVKSELERGLAQLRASSPPRIVKAAVTKVVKTAPSLDSQDSSEDREAYTQKKNLILEAKQLIKPGCTVTQIESAYDKLFKAKELRCKDVELTAVNCVLLSDTLIKRDRPKRQERRSDLDLAIDTLQAGLSDLPQQGEPTARVRLALGRAYLRRNNAAKEKLLSDAEYALNQFQEGLKDTTLRAEMRAACLRARGDAHLQSGCTDKAIQDYEEALALKFDNSHLRGLLEKSLLELRT